MSLVRIIGAEPLPLYPDGISDEMQKYLRDLHNFLRRLGGKFSGQNIVAAIEDETDDDFVGTTYTATAPIDITGTVVSLGYTGPLSKSGTDLTIQDFSVGALAGTTAPITIVGGKIDLLIWDTSLGVYQNKLYAHALIGPYPECKVPFVALKGRKLI